MSEAVPCSSTHIADSLKRLAAELELVSEQVAALASVDSAPNLGAHRNQSWYCFSRLG